MVWSRCDRIKLPTMKPMPNTMAHIGIAKNRYSIVKGKNRQNPVITPDVAPEAPTAR